MQVKRFITQDEECHASFRTNLHFPHEAPIKLGGNFGQIAPRYQSR